MDYNKHSISDDSVSILHKESDWFRRGVAEAIHIQEQAPVLNRGRERHTLPRIYQEILPQPESRDVPTTSLSRDSSEWINS